MSEIASKIPSALRAGDTWAWRRDDIADYPPSEWTLVYALRNADNFLDLAATADSGGYLIEAAPAVTATAIAGDYSWFASVIQETAGTVTARHGIDAGFVKILPDAHAAAVYDARSLPRKILDAIDAALLSRATSDQIDLISTKFSDRALVRDRSSLLELRAKMLIEVKRIEGTGGRVSTINARFR